MMCISDYWDSTDGIWELPENLESGNYQKKMEISDEKKMSDARR